MNIYHTKRAVASVTSTTAAAGFPASQVALEAIGLPWKAAATGAEVLTINFTAPGAFAGLMLQDVNFASCTVDKSPNGSSWSAAGTVTSYPDPKIPGRRRALLALADPTIQAVRLNIANAATTDGTSSHRVGAFYGFQAVSALPLPPDYGLSVKAMFPQLATDLPNGRTALASTGPAYNIAELPFEREYSESLEELIRRSRAGTIGLQLLDSNYPEMFWPVRNEQSEAVEAFPFYAYSQISLFFKEQV